MFHPGLVLHGGRYRLLSRLRDGATAQVWRAFDARDSREVALKAIPVEAGGAEAAEHEAEAAARISHPGVISVHGSFTEAGHGVVAMELARCSLADVVDVHGALDGAGTRAVAAALADVLAATHAAGVVHRDIKPQNVLVMPDGSVRLADFGIARMHARGHSRTGALLGTLPFMAPEQRRDARAVCPATDIYAWAVLVVWMRTGELPGELYVPAALDAVRKRLRAVGEPDDALCALIARAGGYIPADRPADGTALRADLARCWPDVTAPCLQADVEYSASWGGEGTPARNVVAPPAIGLSRGSGVSGVVGVALGVVVAAATGVVAAQWSGEPGVLVAAVGSDDALAELPICDGGVRTLLPIIRHAPEETANATAFDLDGDGLRDAVYTNQLAESLTVWWGTPRGLLVDSTEFKVGRSASAALLYDEGGARELLLPLQDASIIQRWAVSGRTLTALPDIEQPGAPHTAVLAHWDEDDRLDMLVDTSGCLMLRPGDGTGRFPTGTCVAMESTLAVAGAIRIGARMYAVLHGDAGTVLSDGAVDRAPVKRERIAAQRVRAGVDVAAAYAEIRGDLYRWSRGSVPLGTPGAWTACKVGPGQGLNAGISAGTDRSSRQVELAA